MQRYKDILLLTTIKSTVTQLTYNYVSFLLNNLPKRCRKESIFTIP